MEDRFQGFGFSANHLSLNVFGNLSKGIEAQANHLMDTTLRLDSPNAVRLEHSSPKGTKRKWGYLDGALGQDVSSLVLGLGCSSSSSDSKASSATLCTLSSMKETDEESSVELSLNFHLHLGNENPTNSARSAVSAFGNSEMDPKFDLQLTLSTGSSQSGVTFITQTSTQSNSESLTIGKLAVDRELLSSPLKLQCLLPPVQNTEGNLLHVPSSSKVDLSAAGPNLSSTLLSTSKSFLTCNSSLMQQPHRSPISKTCNIEGCQKGARGASGLCIAHGGGRRCQKAGCQKGAEGRTVYCKAHGGGRRCESLGCTKSAEGRTDHCIAHGGGRRCNHDGCPRAARGKSGLCIRHGGGKRCQKENCTKSAEGFSGLCISHGGGRRCQFPACTKGAQGSTMFCKAHGGGKRCTFPGCTKGAEGSTPFCKGHGGGKRCSFQGGGVCPKSVHGGTLFCVAHGGGKRCASPACTRSARGRTDYCVGHGGGKRCKQEGCGKSAQGSTDFCKAHGGGKRCSWGHPGSEYCSQGQAPCDRFARGKTTLCSAHIALVQDSRVHGGVPLCSAIQDPESIKSAFEYMNIDAEKTNCPPYAVGGISEPKRQVQSLQAQVHPAVDEMASRLPPSASLPEGRVHGGGLLALLAGSTSNQAVHNSSDQGRSVLIHKWMNA